MKISTGGLLLLVVVLISNVEEGQSASSACSDAEQIKTAKYVQLCKTQDVDSSKCKKVHFADTFRCTGDVVCDKIKDILAKIKTHPYACETSKGTSCEKISATFSSLEYICKATTITPTIPNKIGTNCKQLDTTLTFSTDNTKTACVEIPNDQQVCTKDKGCTGTYLCKSDGTAISAGIGLCTPATKPTIASGCENVFHKNYKLICTTDDAANCQTSATGVSFKDGKEAIESHETARYYCTDSRTDKTKCQTLKEAVNFVCSNHKCVNKGLPIDTSSYAHACNSEVKKPEDCKSINIADEFRCSAGACASVVENVLAKIFPTYSQVCKSNVPNKCASVTSVSADVKQICVAKVDSTTFNKNLFTDCRNLEGKLKFDSTNTGSNCVDLSSYNYFNCDGTSKVCDKTKTYLCDDASASLDSHLCKLSPKCEALTSITYSHLCDKPTTATECQELPAIKLLYSNKGKIISPVYGKTFYCSANQANYTCTALATTDEQPTYKCDTSFSECKALSNSSATNTYYGCPNATYTTACFDVDNSKVYFGQSGKVTIPGTVKKLCNVGTAAGCLTTPTYIIDRSCTKQATSTAATKTKTTKPGAGNQLTASWIFTTASILFATKLM